MQAVPLSRINSILIFAFAFCAALYFGEAFFVPLTFAILLSMLLLPVCVRLERRMNRSLASILCVLIVFFGVLAILTLLSAPAASFNEDIPKLKSGWEEQWKRIQQLLEERLNVSRQQQQSLLKQGSSALQSAGKFLGLFVTGIFSLMADFLLVLVYMFFFLSQRHIYRNFFLKLNSDNNPSEVRQVLQQISKVSQQYVGGRFLAILILGTLYAIGLSIVGVPYAILLAFIASLLTIIPYVGTITGGLLSVGVSLLSGSGQAALGAIVVIGIVQLLDEYFLEPYIVGGNVNLNPLATIVIIVIGGYLWGVAGMILFIPLLAMAKIVFDHVPKLHPYGYLVGDQEEESAAVKKVKQWWKKVKR